MDLLPTDSTSNLLPHDGSVTYHGPIFSATESQRIFTELMEDIPWQQDETVMFGKRIITARKVAWFADDNYPYKYSGTTKQAQPWTAGLLALKEVAERTTAATFNSCLLNLYHDGNEGMSWHSDDEKTLVADAPIASLSFGAARRFRLKHKRSQESVALVLENGSLLEMKGETQTHWLHCLPKTKKITTPRINLTFRRMIVPGARKASKTSP